MIDRRVLERPGNVAIDDNGGFEQLQAWARAGTVGGNHLWMQISHAGRQSPRYVTGQPLAPSEVRLDLLGNYARPRALTEDEIGDFVQRFARVAGTAQEAGFTGVQIHAAHGYLISEFLSPVVNRRNDQWGGSLENRARFLLETVRAVRERVGSSFPIAVKLNSADFQKGGFDHADSLQVAQWLSEAGIDLLEISGGTYEQPRLLGVDGRRETASEPLAESTRRREAYFLEYAQDIRRVVEVPLMVTGGFRTRGAMVEALEAGELDVIGLARPLCTVTDWPRRLLAAEVEDGPRHEDRLVLGRGLWGPHSPVFPIKIVNIFGAQGWHCLQLLRMGDGREPDLGMGLLKAFCLYFADELKTARARKRALRTD